MNHHFTNTRNPVDFPKSDNTMNTLIKEIADRAGFVRFSPEEDPHTPIDWSCDYTEELNRFAELIVRECADVGYDSSYYDCALHVSNMIKKHFGVKE